MKIEERFNKLIELMLHTVERNILCEDYIFALKKLKYPENPKPKCKFEVGDSISIYNYAMKHIGKVIALNEGKTMIYTSVADFCNTWYSIKQCRKLKEKR